MGETFVVEACRWKKGAKWMPLGGVTGSEKAFTDAWSKAEVFPKSEKINTLQKNGHRPCLGAGSRPAGKAAANGAAGCFFLLACF
jgi:hypothetical protein